MTLPKAAQEKVFELADEYIVNFVDEDGYSCMPGEHQCFVAGHSIGFLDGQKAERDQVIENIVSAKYELAALISAPGKEVGMDDIPNELNDEDRRCIANAFNYLKALDQYLKQAGDV